MRRSDYRRTGKAPRFAEPDDVKEQTQAPADTLHHILDVQGISPDQVAFVWSDTEGSEFRVIETGQALWEAGVPLYIEVFPQALRVQNGLEAFIELAARYFTRFMVSADLASGELESCSRPVSELEHLADRLLKAQAQGGCISPMFFYCLRVSASRKSTALRTPAAA